MIYSTAEEVCACVCVYIRMNKVSLWRALSDVLRYRCLTFRSNNIAKYDITIHSVNETHPYYSQHNVNGIKLYSTEQK